MRDPRHQPDGRPALPSSPNHSRRRRFGGKGRGRTLAAAVLALLLPASAVVAFRMFRGSDLPGGNPAADSDSRTPTRTSGAMQALDLWSAQRAYPGRVIPDVGHAAAFAYSKAALRGPADDLGRNADGDLVGNAWTPIGPHNIGGRTLAVAQNPQNLATVWAGAASGGLWRSFTAGVGADAWDQIPTGHPLLGVSSIAIAPDDSNVIYIGTGEVYGYQNALGGLAVRLTRGSYGIGILKSIDGGATWSHSLNWSQSQRRGVASLAMHPADPNIVYAGTTEGTYKTTNGGTSWTLVHNVLMAMHVVIDPAEPNRVYVACGDLGSPNPGIYRTIDSGTNWVKLSTGLPATWSGKGWLDIYEASPNVIYASLSDAEDQSVGAGKLFYSVNGGNSWVQLSSNNYATYQGWYSHWVHVSPTDSSQVLVGGIDIWRSTNGGRSQTRVSDWSAWFFGTPPPGGPEGPTNYAHADHHAVIHDLGTPNTLYFATDGGVFRSLDGGQTFAGVNGGYQTQQFYNGFTSAVPNADLAMGGMQDNATAIYEGTVAWRRVIGGDGCWTAIHPTNLNTLYGESQYLNIRRSTNGGASFSLVTSGIGGETAAFVGPYLLSPVNPSIMYAGKTKIYRSTNGASNWTVTNANLELDSNPALAMAISNTSTDVVYVATAPVNTRSGVFVTTNGGILWTNITSTLPDRYPVDLAVDPIDDQIAYIVMSGFGSGHLFQTTNRGVSWTDLTGTLPDVPASAIAIDPDNTDHLYFGNDIGVYVSTNAGSTWQEYAAGMPDAAIVMDLSVVVSTRRLRAATHGNGVFERALLEPTTAVAAAEPVPAARLVLLGSAPNPFTGSALVRFRLGERLPVEVDLVDAAGRKLATLLSGERGPGEHRVRLDARNLGLASGVYFCRVRAGGETASERLVLAR